RGIKNDMEFRRNVSKFDTEQPTHLDRTLAAIYLWGAHLRIREAIEVMIGRKILDEEGVLDEVMGLQTSELQRYIERAVEKVWRNPDKLAEIVESFYEWGKK
ncbi:MAG: hypothetical protein Q8L34_03715, partial [Candidatus Woesearchaeota archaeon]|nr:hypothetical protein [Candidatus Woesearchaeota archaeon]